MLEVTCRICSKPVTWSRWRPFCSDRCPMIDLGAWFEEEHTILGEVAPVDPDAGTNTP